MTLHFPMMLIMSQIINLTICFFISCLGVAAIILALAFLRGHFHIHHYNKKED